MCRAAAAPESGAGSREAAAKVDFTFHCAHIASSIAGAIHTKYMGSKNIVLENLLICRGAAASRRPSILDLLASPAWHPFRSHVVRIAPAFGFGPDGIPRAHRRLQRTGHAAAGGGARAG